MNKVILMGRLTKDPEIRYSQSAEPVCVSRFSIAVNKRYKKEGEPDADFINCVAFRRSAEFIERYIKKGMMVSLCGSLSVRSYEDKSGQRRWVTEVQAEEVNFAESRAAYEARTVKSEVNGHDTALPDPPVDGTEGFSPIFESIDDDDLPF